MDILLKNDRFVHFDAKFARDSFFFLQIRFSTQYPRILSFSSYVWI